MIKSTKKSNRTLKFTCSNYSFQPESSQKILKTSKHHIAAAPLAQMESQQSLLLAVLPCKHQRCVVLGRRKCGTKLSRWCKFHTNSHGGLFVFNFEVSTSIQRCEDPFPERQTSLIAPGSEMRHIKQMSVTFRTSLKIVASCLQTPSLLLAGTRIQHAALEHTRRRAKGHHIIIILNLITITITHYYYIHFNIVCRTYMIYIYYIIYYIYIYILYIIYYIYIYARHI